MFGAKRRRKPNLKLALLIGGVLVGAASLIRALKAKKSDEDDLPADPEGLERESRELVESVSFHMQDLLERANKLAEAAEEVASKSREQSEA